MKWQGGYVRQHTKRKAAVEVTSANEENCKKMARSAGEDGVGEIH